MLDKPEIQLSDAELEDLATIEKSGQFDHDWYYQNNPDVAAARINGIIHYIKHGAAEGRNPNTTFDTSTYRRVKAAAIPAEQNPFAHFILYGSADDLFNRGMLVAFSAGTLRQGISRLSRLPVYSDADYLRLNCDIVSANIRPAEHALLYGFPEGRGIFDKTTVSRALGRLARATADPSTGLHEAGAAKPLPAGVGIYFNSQGNGFIKEIAADLVASLLAAGINARLLDEQSSIDDRPPANVIVAPHEFFHLGAGRNWARDDVIRNSFMFNTEQPQTIWFERGVPFVLMSRGVIDICGQLAAMFAETGMPALHFNPEVTRSRHWLLADDMTHPLVRVLPKSARAMPRPEIPFAQRPIDISFFGGSSAHRDNFFVRNARFLAEYECFLYYRRFEGPHTNSKRDGVLSRLGGHVTAHSKISLNVHRDDYGFFEWHRIVKLAMAGGSVMVTEPCLPHVLYKPGVHFFEETGRHMPDLLDWLLKSPDGRARAEEVRANAMALVYDRDVAARHHAALRDFIAVHSASSS